MKMMGAIFDLDGTLLDSMHVWQRFGALYLESRGIGAPPDLTETLKTMSLPQAASYFRETFGFEETQQELLAQFGELLVRQYRERVSLKGHVLPFLRRLKSAGVRMCVATATDKGAAGAALERLGALEFFDFILCCADVGCGKESPAIYLAALERLGTAKAETVVFEDALHAARTAKAAGFPVVGVFDASAAADRQELTRLVDRYINSFEEWEFEADV